MQLGAPYHEPLCFLALDAFAPVRTGLVAAAGRLQQTALDLLRAPDPGADAVIGTLQQFPLTFAPSTLGDLLHHWYARPLPPEVSALTNAVFPFDSEGRQHHAQFRAVFGNETALDAALMHYADTETTLFAAFNAVETTLVSRDVTDRDIAIITANLRFDLNRAATHAFQLALMRFIRARIICDYFAATRIKQSQVQRFAEAIRLPITQTHLEGLWARVH
jgi:hypothetical protein